MYPHQTSDQKSRVETTRYAQRLRLGSQVPWFKSGQFPESTRFIKAITGVPGGRITTARNHCNYRGTQGQPGMIDRLPGRGHN